MPILHQFGLVFTLILLALPVSAREGRTVILISWDGTHPSYITPTDAPTLTQLAQNGATAQSMLPIFPSSTFPCHATLATGCTADHHGIVSNQFIDRQRGEFNFSNDSTWLGCEPLWISAEKAGLKSATLLWPSSGSPWQGVLQSYLMKPPSLRVDDLIKLPEWPRYEQIIRWLSLPDRERPRLILAWFPDIDTQGHQFGPGSREVRKAVRRYDKLLKKFIRQLKKLPHYSSIDLIVVSDHGMARMTHTISLPALTAELTRQGIQEVKVTASGTNANLYFKTAAQTTRAARALQALGSDLGAFAAYSVRGLPTELHYQNPRAGVTLVGNDGYYFDKKGPVDHFINEPPNDHIGKHGYPPHRSSSMHAIFYAQGPDFPAGTVYETLPSTEVAPLIRKILDLPSPETTP